MTLCPRARYRGTTPARFFVAKDPAVQEVARMVVAGVDRRYNLHPRYDDLVRGYGEEKAETLISEAVDIAGACDIIQTEMDLGGVGLFGGLSENRRAFIFYEWTDLTMRMRITRQEARDIVAGKKKTVRFLPCTKAHFAARKRMRESRG